MLLHDSLGCVALWRNFPELLATRLSRTVIAYDRLGFGESSVSEQPANIDFIEREAQQYFQEVKQLLAIKHYYLLGYSVGGAMAYNIAAQDIDCKAVISIAAQAFVEEKTLQGIKLARDNFAEPEQMARLARWHHDKADWVLNAWVDVWLSPEFARWSLINCLNKVQCPIFVIHGCEDEYGSIAFPEFIARNVAGHSQLLLLENCGHMPHREHSGAVLNGITCFLDNEVIDE